jgi:hypothetical protein
MLHHAGIETSAILKTVDTVSAIYARRDADSGYALIVEERGR